MTKSRRVALGIAVGLAVLLAWQHGYLQWVPAVGPAGSIEHVVVVSESGDQTAAQAAVVLGKTSRELRDANKWRSWDVDEIPESIRPTIMKLIEGRGLPVVILFRGGKVFSTTPLPGTDEELRALIEKYGGF